MAFAVGMAVFQTLTLKKRKQQNTIDSFMLVSLLIHCCSMVGTVLLGSATFLTVYIYWVYKTQRIVEALPPFDELKTIKFLWILAFILKASLLVGRSALFSVLAWELSSLFYCTLKITHSNLRLPQIADQVLQCDWPTNQL